MTATADSAKDYLYSKEIPRMFECLIGALMHHQPANPVSFVRDCLVQMKDKGGLEALKWNTLIDQAPPATSAAQISELKAKWTPLLSQRPLPPIIPLPDLDKPGVRPVICLVGADKAFVHEVSSILLRQYDFVVRHTGKEPMANDITTSTNVITSWINLITRQQSTSSGFLLTEYPPTISHLDALLKKKLVAPNLVLVVHLKNKKPVSPTLTACIERASTKVHVIEIDTILAEDSATEVVNVIIERFRIHPSRSKLNTRMSARLKSARSSGDAIFTIKGENFDASATRKVDLNPSVQLRLLFVGPEFKDYADRLSKLPKVQCVTQIVDDSDEKAHQQLLATLITVEENSRVVCINFPRSEAQLHWLLTRVGGVSGAALVDYSESLLQERMSSSKSDNNSVFEFYKEETIPVVHWLDRSGLLVLHCRIEDLDKEELAFKDVEEFIMAETVEKGKKKITGEMAAEPSAAVTAISPPSVAAETKSSVLDSSNETTATVKVEQPTPPPSRHASPPVVPQEQEQEQEQKKEADDEEAKVVETVAAVTVGAVLVGAVAAAEEQEKEEERQKTPRPEQGVPESQDEVKPPPSPSPPSDEVVVEEPIIAVEQANFVGEGDNPNPAYSAVLDQPPTQAEEEVAEKVLEEVIAEAQSATNVTGDNDNPNPAYSAVLDSPPEVQSNQDQEEETNNAPDEKLKNTKVVFVLGGPGSGKGTQCERLVKKYGFAHLSTGDLLRAEVASGSARGKKLESTMAAGELVTLDTVLELLRDAMVAAVEKGPAPGFLIDGFPRELDQALRFEKEIKAPDAVLFFDVSEATMRARLLNRGKTSGRVDDNEETIVKRFKTFEQHSKPVVEHYKPSGKLHQFKAEAAPDEIFKSVEGVMDPLMGVKK